MLPKPPMTTMKMAKAVQLMENEAAGWMRSRFIATTAPMAPQPKAATT